MFDSVHHFLHCIQWNLTVIYSSGQKKVRVCIAFLFPFRAKKHKRNASGKECISYTVFEVFMIFAGIIQAISELFEIMNNTGNLYCCYYPFKKPGTEASGDSTFLRTLNKPK